MKDSRTGVSGAKRSLVVEGSGSGACILCVLEGGLGGPPSRDWGHRAGLGPGSAASPPKAMVSSLYQGGGPPQHCADGTSLPCEGLSRVQRCVSEELCPQPRRWARLDPHLLPGWVPACGAALSLREGPAFCPRTKSAVSFFPCFRLFHHRHRCSGTDHWDRRVVGQVGADAPVCPAGAPLPALGTMTLSASSLPIGNTRALSRLIIYQIGSENSCFPWM